MHSGTVTLRVMYCRKEKGALWKCCLGCQNTVEHPTHFPPSLPFLLTLLPQPFVFGDIGRVQCIFFQSEDLGMLPGKVIKLLKYWGTMFYFMLCLCSESIMLFHLQHYCTNMYLTLLYKMVAVERIRYWSECQKKKIGNIWYLRKID